MIYFKKEHILTILDIIKKLDKSKYAIAIDGLGGSGKSTLADELSGYVNNAIIIRMDDFYKTKEMRNKLNSKEDIGGYFDWERLEKQILIPFAEDRSSKYQKYNWLNDKLCNSGNIQKSKNIIVEGIYSNRTELSKYYNIKIWIECPEDIRLSRGIARDGKEMKEYWQNVWVIQEKRYYEEHKPYLRADIILNNGKA